jgi:tetratricopeptide (TPR) repeat protein
VHAGSEAKFTQNYSDIAKIAGLSPDLKGEDLLHAVQLWMEQRTNWLLVLDNADDLKIFKNLYSVRQDDRDHSRSPELLRFVPKSPSGMVIWTSRDGAILGSLVGVGRGVEVGLMTGQESWKLFQKLGGESDIEGPSAEGPSESEDQLLKLLERLPLAIAQAAAYIRKTKVSIQQYLVFFKESDSRQSKLLSREFEDVHRSDVPNSVMHTWLISMRHIAQESPCGEKILNTIAFFDNQGLPFEFLRAAAGSSFSEDEVLLAAGRLTEYSFLQAQRMTDEGLPAYEQHRLVQLATRRSLTTTQTRSFSGRALEVVVNLFPSGDHETWSSCKLYLPHALKAVGWLEAEGFNDQAPSLLARIGIYYWQQGRSEEAEELEVQVLELRKSVLGEKHPDTILAMANLASTWQQQGRSDEAEQLEVQVLELQKSVLGEKHPATITAMANLTSTWWQQGRSDEAEQLEVQVLELRKSVLGEKHPATITAMANLTLIRNSATAID